jgi:hypothetical protein
MPLSANGLKQKKHLAANWGNCETQLATVGVNQTRLNQPSNQNKKPPYLRRFSKKN